MTRRPILIYDADCSFCSRWVSRLKRWDRRDVVELLPLTDAKACAVTNTDQSALRQAVHLVLPSGEVFAGAAAARELLAFVPHGWLPRMVLGLPGALRWADCVYHWIARTWGPAGNTAAAEREWPGGVTNGRGGG
ncbi:MAG TPA: DUF393 domain-containing protein [Gemmatimonadales bacterium]|nr:DUF393 domain-containing protein [Gemmatimonadales bacterium]